jgi:hypothetical protein
LVPATVNGAPEDTGPFADEKSSDDRTGASNVYARLLVPTNEEIVTTPLPVAALRPTPSRPRRPCWVPQTSCVPLTHTSE